MESNQDLTAPVVNFINSSKIFLYSQYSCTGEFPQTLKEANMSSILKKGKCSDSCRSYRPIALLNVERKLLSKILASCLENLLSNTGKGRQDRFCKGHNSATNVRRLLNAILAFKQESTNGLVLSLNAEKASDRIECLSYCIHWVNLVWGRTL